MHADRRVPIDLEGGMREIYLALGVGYWDVYMH